MTHSIQVTVETIDAILQLQFRVAWAGEALCDPPRLKWWRTDLLDPLSGGDFIKRLAPRTHPWAGLAAAREAARLTDLKARQLLADPDSVRTLYFWGFELDEMLADRIRDNKWSARPAPQMGDFVAHELESEFRALATEASYNVQASGRQMRGPLPEDPLRAARMLVAALAPLADSYPTPFFRL